MTHTSALSASQVSPRVYNQRRTTTPTARVRFQKSYVGKIYWLHLRVHDLTRGGPRAHCRYPEDRVPLRTIFKSTQGAARAAMHCHVSYSFGPHLLAREGSGAATCSTAPDPTSLLRRDPVLPCVPRLRILPPAREGSGATTCPTAPDPASLLGRALVLPHVPRLNTGRE
jgi:hypothetical protein